MFIVFCDYLINNLELRTIGTLLYVSKNCREIARYQLIEHRIPRLSRLFICYCGNSGTTLAGYIRHAMLQQIRVCMNNPYIPDGISFADLINVTPNFHDEGLIPDPNHLQRMQEAYEEFVRRNGYDKQNNKYIYHTVLYRQGKFNESARISYHELVGKHFAAITSNKGSASDDLIFHISFLITWYALL